MNVATLDEDGKIDELKLIFTGLRDVDLKLALKKAKGDFTKACEELLNLQYLEENGLRPKGIEGAFRHDQTPDRPRKLAKISFSLVAARLVVSALISSCWEHSPFSLRVQTH